VRAIQNLSTATPDTIRRELFQSVQHLLRLIRRGHDVLGELQEVRDLLESLPLASGEYSTATNRLRNTHRYLVSEERGAARYELQMLTGMLRPDNTKNATNSGRRMRRVARNCVARTPTE